MVLRTISWGFCNKGTSCPGRCETSRRVDGTLLNGPSLGGSRRVHTWDGLRCHLAWRWAGRPRQLLHRSLFTRGSGKKVTLSSPGHLLQVSMHLAMHRDAPRFPNELLRGPPRTLTSSYASPPGACFSPISSLAGATARCVCCSESWGMLSRFSKLLPSGERRREDGSSLRE